MGHYVASELVKQMLKKNLQVNQSKVLVLGFTFKENCPDVRNTKVVDVVRNLEDYNINVSIYDPWANPTEVKTEYNLETFTQLPQEKYQAIVLAVSHQEFLGLDIDSLLCENGVVYDVKGTLDRKEHITRL